MYVALNAINIVAWLCVAAVGLNGDETKSGRGLILNNEWVEPIATLIIPISACYYLELHSAITSYSGVQFLLTKVQKVVWKL